MCDQTKAVLEEGVAAVNVYREAPDPSQSVYWTWSYRLVDGRTRYSVSSHLFLPNSSSYEVNLCFLFVVHVDLERLEMNEEKHRRKLRDVSRCHHL